MRKKLQKKTDPKNVNKVEGKINKWYYNTFKHNLLQRGRLYENERYNFLLREVTSQKSAILYVYTCILCVVFEDVDFPGLVLKTKGYDVPKAPEYVEPSEAEIEQTIRGIRMRTKFMPKKLSEEEIRKRALNDLNRNIEKKRAQYEHNKAIFDRNIKNVWLSEDKSYI